MIEMFNRAKIVLNFSSSAGHKKLTNLNGRVFEVLATSSFLIAEEAEDLDKYFISGKELVTFSGKEDLLGKVKYYLKAEKEREMIAKRGYQKIQGRYSISMLLNRILEA